MFTSSGYFRGVDCPFYIQGRGQCRRPYCHFRHVRSCRETPNAAKAVENTSGNGCSYVATPLVNCPNEEGTRGTNDDDPPSSGVLQYKATPIQQESTPQYSYKATRMYGHFGSNLPETPDDPTFSEIEESNNIQKNNKTLKRHNSAPTPEKSLDVDDVPGSKRYSLDSLLPFNSDGEYDPVIVSATLNKDVSQKTEFVYRATKKDKKLTGYASGASSSENELAYNPMTNYSTNNIGKDNVSCRSIESKGSKRSGDVEGADAVSNKKMRQDGTSESKKLVDVGSAGDVSDIKMEENDIPSYDLQYSSDTTGELQIVESDENEACNNVEKPVEAKPKISEEKLGEFFQKMKSAKVSTKKLKINESFSEMMSKKKNLEQKSNENSNRTTKINENDEDIKKENDPKNGNSDIGSLKNENDSKKVKKKTIKGSSKTFQKAKLQSNRSLKIEKSDSSLKSKSSKKNQSKKTVERTKSKRKTTKVMSSKLKTGSKSNSSVSKSKTPLKQCTTSSGKKTLENGDIIDLTRSDEDKSDAIKRAKKIVENKTVLTPKKDIYSLSSSSEESGIKRQIKKLGESILTSSKKDVYSLSSSSQESGNKRQIKPIKKLGESILNSSKKDVYSLSSSSDSTKKLPKIIKRKISIELFGEDSDEEESGNIFKKMRLASSLNKTDSKSLHKARDNKTPIKGTKKPLEKQSKNNHSLVSGKTKASKETRPTPTTDKEKMNTIAISTDSDASIDDFLNDDVPYNDISSDILSDLTDFETDTYEECLKIFNEETEFKTEEVPDNKMEVEEDFADTARTGRKRHAHVSKYGEAARRQLQRRIAGPSPAQVCHNRYLKLQQLLANRKMNTSVDRKPSLDKRRQAHLPKVVPKPSVPVKKATTTTSPHASKTSTSVASKTPTNSASKTPNRVATKTPNRVASNTSSRVASNTPTSGSKSIGKRLAHNSAPSKSNQVREWVTIAGTADKRDKRVAHIPTTKASKRPLIPVEYGKHIPNVVRQRYLTIFIDELLKVGLEEQTAFDTALEEEKVACEKASSKTVYLNVCINTVKRIRSMDCRNAKKRLSTTPKKSVSHLANIGGKLAAQTSFSIQRKVVVDPSKLRGLALYNKLKRYTLSEQELKDNGYPRIDPDTSGKAKVYVEEKKKVKSSDPNHNICTRCGKEFLRRPDGRYITREECLYHWGKCWKRKVAGSLENRYTCCSGDGDATGCCVGKFHVTDDKSGNFEGFMKTIAKSPLRNESPGVFAVDCEMCYTNKGLELTRVTVIGESMQKVYDSLVKPTNPVIDHNSRFSGITEDDMKSVTTTIRDVQAVLLSLFSAETILLGHSLESDLLALKLIHSTVVDTALVFPHRRGPPFKRALRTLMAECLNKIIQNSVDGHDSTEDAKSCLELMLWRIKEDTKIKSHS